MCNLTKRNSWPRSFGRSNIKWLVSALLIASCSFAPDYEPYREKVRAELRDPASAEFRAEKIRTLWTVGGKRLQLYCAEVNSNNAFGGKTGFLPVRYLIAARNTDFYSFALSKDPLWTDVRMTNSFYLDCVRPDTQRSDENFGLAFPGEFDAAMMDRSEPIISMDVAPEER